MVRPAQIALVPEIQPHVPLPAAPRASATPVAAEPARAPPSPPTAAVLEAADPAASSEVDGLSVRRFFNHLVLRGAEDPKAAPSSWEETSVDAFFLRLTEGPPENVLNPERRESGVGRESVKQAFAGFAWD